MVESLHTTTAPRSPVHKRMYDRCMTAVYRPTMGIVNVRISGEAEQALAELTADGTSTSEAVRRALLDAVFLRRRRQMRAEAARALADPDDRAAVEEAMQEWADVDPG